MFWNIKCSIGFQRPIVDSLKIQYNKIFTQMNSYLLFVEFRNINTNRAKILPSRGFRVIMGDIKPKVSVTSEKQGWEKSASEAQEWLLLPNVTWEDSQMTPLLWLAFESLLLLYFISMIKGEINLAFLEISPIFLWPVSSWPLWSGKMAVGITYFVSWV